MGPILPIHFVWVSLAQTFWCWCSTLTCTWYRRETSSQGLLLGRSICKLLTSTLFLNHRQQLGNYMLHPVTVKASPSPTNQAVPIALDKTENKFSLQTLPPGFRSRYGISKNISNTMLTSPRFQLSRQKKPSVKWDIPLNWISHCRKKIRQAPQAACVIFLSCPDQMKV